MSPELAGGQILVGGSWLLLFISVVSLVKIRFYFKKLLFINTLFFLSAYLNLINSFSF